MVILKEPVLVLPLQLGELVGVVGSGVVEGANVDGVFDVASVIRVGDVVGSRVDNKTKTRGKRIG